MRTIRFQSLVLALTTSFLINLSTPATAQGLFDDQALALSSWLSRPMVVIHKSIALWRMQKAPPRVSVGANIPLLLLDLSVGVAALSDGMPHRRLIFAVSIFLPVIAMVALDKNSVVAEFLRTRIHRISPGAFLQWLMKKRGYSIEFLVQVTKLSKSTWYYYLSDFNTPSLEVITHIAAYLHFVVAEYLEHIDTPYRERIRKRKIRKWKSPGPDVKPAGVEPITRSPTAGEHLRAHRLRKGLRQSELGKELGIGQSHVAALENGRPMSWNLKVLAAGVLGFDVAEFSEFDDPPSAPKLWESEIDEWRRAMGQKIREHRLEQGLSFEDLASQVNWKGNAQAFTESIEHGLYEFDFKTARQLGSLLNATDLLTESASTLPSGLQVVLNLKVLSRQTGLAKEGQMMTWLHQLKEETISLPDLFRLVKEVGTTMVEALNLPVLARDKLLAQRILPLREKVLKEALEGLVDSPKSERIRESFRMYKRIYSRNADLLSDFLAIYNPAGPPTLVSLAEKWSISQVRISGVISSAMRWLDRFISGTLIPRQADKLARIAA